MEKERFNTITELYAELEQLRELQQQIVDFKKKYKNSPCVFSEEIQGLLENRIEELKTKIVDFQN